MAKDSLQIVIVDDVKAVANSLRRELRFIARKNEILFSINDFQDPDDAYLYINSNPVNLLITDIKMPFMTGDKLVEKVKAKFPELPVIVITGYATKENIINIYKADKNCVVLTKPWELESLLNALSKLLKMALELPSGDME